VELGVIGVDLGGEAKGGQPLKARVLNLERQTRRELRDEIRLLVRIARKDVVVVLLGNSQRRCHSQRPSDGRRIQKIRSDPRLEQDAWDVRRRQGARPQVWGGRPCLSQRDGRTWSLRLAAGGRLAGCRLRDEN